MHRGPCPHRTVHGRRLSPPSGFCTFAHAGGFPQVPCFGSIPPRFISKWPFGRATGCFWHVSFSGSSAESISDEFSEPWNLPPSPDGSRGCPVARSARRGNWRVLGSVRDRDPARLCRPEALSWRRDSRPGAGAVESTGGLSSPAVPRAQGRVHCVLQRHILTAASGGPTAQALPCSAALSPDVPWGPAAAPWGWHRPRLLKGRGVRACGTAWLCVACRAHAGGPRGPACESV